MEISNKIASDIITFCKYAKYNEKAKRRETWEETLDRTMQMHLKKYPQLDKKIRKAFKYVEQKKILPSMRSLQFGGRAIELSNSRVYNCAFMAACYADFFPELMFLLLGGTGVGYSVQWRHVSQLPAIKRPAEARKYVIQDSIVGWADAVKKLIRAYLSGTYLPKFVYDDIRPAGTPLKTAGGSAPGPAPLRNCLSQIQGLIESKPVGSKLQSWEVSDIACIIADAVLAGGIRRSAMIALFDIDDDSMLGYKHKDFYLEHPERGRVNISACAFRKDVVDEFGHTIAKTTTVGQFEEFWAYVERNNTGDPGIYWTDHPDWGTNPCCEIALRHKQFCNLTTINFAAVQSQEDLNELAYNAAVIGTLQAGYTDLHYLSDGWKRNCEDEALLGVSVTGIADGGHYKRYDWRQAASRCNEGNVEIARAIGIKQAARVTCIKPEGTASLVLGTSSGVHARHAHYYIRRVRFGKEEPIARYLSENHPELVAQDLYKPDGIVAEFPQKAPDRSIYRTESPLELLERVKFFHENWVMPGHRSGDNHHNVSCTIYVKGDEWPVVGQWMYINRNSYNGIAVFPYDGGSHEQSPFEDTTKEVYDRMMLSLKDVDLTKIIENADHTNLKGEVACQGASCEIV